MSTALDQIVNIVITQQTKAVPQPAFSIPLIVGPTGFGVSPDVIRYYTSAAALLTDGFVTSDPEYIYAVEMEEQDLTPTQFGVGKRLAAVAQIDTVTVTAAVPAHVYRITIGTTDYSYTAGGGDTTTVIAAALAALIAADTASPAGAGASGAVITLTAVVAGAGFTTSIHADADMSLVHTLANHGIQNDLTTILADPIGDLWYGWVVCSNTYGDITQAAAITETLKKIFLGATADSAVDSSSTTDVASVLQSKSYKRSGLMYSPGSAAMGIDAGLLGGQLPQVPGSSTWKFKTIVGITPDFFTDTSRTRLIGVPGVSKGKGVNIYETVGGVGITEEGWMAGGQFIDVTVGIDWLESILQTNIFRQLAVLAKIPYTDKGAAIIENEVRAAMKLADDDGGTGLLDATSIVITTKKVVTVPANTRANRILPPGVVTFAARLAGAFHFVNVSGTVSV